MANVTVDIQARVTGYEASIKALQAALAKVDPGSDMGKKISAALTAAQKQVQDLGRNMFPKASSETQIDVIVEKVNRVGAAIQNVSAMFASLNTGDLNLGALGPEISSVVGEIEKLQNAVNTTLNGGIQEAVANSELLSSVFKDLGVDVKSMTAEGGKIALTQGLVDAKASADEAAAAFEEAKNKVLNIQSELASMKGSSQFLADGFNIDDLLGQLKDLKDPEKLIDITALQNIKQRLLETLTSSKVEDKGAAQELIENIFGSIQPDTALATFKDQFQKLKDGMTKMGMTASEFKGAMGMGGDGTGLFRSLLGIDDSSVETTKAKLKAIVDTFRSSFTTDNYNKTIQLINENAFSAASERAQSAISKHFDKIIGEYRKKQEEFRLATEEQGAAENVSNNANATADRLNQANVAYDTRMAGLEQQVASQRQEIVALRNQVNTLQTAALSQTQREAGGAGANAGKQHFPTSEASKYKSELGQIHSAEQMVGKLQGVTQRWFSVYAAVRMVTKAIKQVVNNAKELDKTITEIAIVTNMNQDQLWGQMDSYIQMARQYGASISGAYKVSQLYYQQGLGQEDVMALSEQTLKMARISGLDYAQATDYMTNAVRSFKLEMQDAQSVVDTYSAVAAKSATSVTEIATAMSKTASSAESVGASLQNTSAMMAVMIEATRESPENIGSAMKSIISRYGELKENKTGIDAEGEEYSLNKVDKALQTVGISIHDAKGEFRDFDDVIMELAENWDTIDKNTQRYIATVMAGNRQQSRFLALVSSFDRLKELSTTAADSEDASQAQFLKTMDSIEYKSQQLQTSLQSLWTESGVQNLIKGTLDGLNNIVTTFTNMPKTFDLPIAAIAKFGAQFANIARIVTTTFGLIKIGVARQIDAIRSEGLTKAQAAADQEVNIEQMKNQRILESRAMTDAYIYGRQTRGMTPEEAKAYSLGLFDTGAGAGAAQQLTGKQKLKALFGKGGKGTAIAGYGLSILGSALSMSAMSMSEDTQDERDAKARTTFFGSMATGAGMGAMFGPWGAAIGGVVGAISGIIQAIDISTETAEERATRLDKQLENAKNENIQKTSEFKNLKETINEYEKLKDAHLDSSDAAQQYIDKCNQIAEDHPDLVEGYDAEGNAVINLAAAYDKLRASKEKVSETEKAEADASINLAKNSVKEADAKLTLAKQNEILVSGTGKDAKEAREEMSQWAASMQDNGNIHQFGEYDDIVNKTLTDLQVDVGTGLKTIRDNLNVFETIASTYSDIQDSTIYEILKLLPRIKEETKASENLNSEDKEIAKSASDVLREETIKKGKVRVSTKSVVDSELAERELIDKVNGGDSFAYLSDVKNASTLFTNVIAKKANEYEGEDYFAKQFDEDFKEVDDALKKYVTMFPDLASKLDEVIAEQGNLTESEMIELVEDTLKIDSSSPLYNAILDYYKNLFTTSETVQELFEEHSKQSNDTAFLGDIFANRSALYENLGQYELQSLVQFYNTLREKVKSSDISESIATSIADTYLDLWTAAIHYSSTDAEKANEIQKLLTSSDLTSNEGVEAFAESLEGLGVTLADLKLDPDILKNIKFPENFSGRAQAFASEFAEQLTKFDKDLTSLSKGLDYSDVSKMADKLGISIADFKQVGNKFYLDDTAALEEYYFKDQQKKIASLKDAENEELKALDNFSFEGVSGLNDEVKALQAEFGDKWADHITDLFNENIVKGFTEALSNQSISPERLKAQLIDYAENGQKDQTFMQYMKENFEKEYEAYVEASDKALDYSIASFYLSAGNIDAFLEKVGHANDAELSSRIAAGDIADLPEDLQKYGKLIFDTFSNTKSSVVSAVFDVLEGGNENIWVNGTNKDFLFEMQSNGWVSGNVEDGKMVQLEVEKMLQNETQFKEWVAAKATSRQQRIEWLQKYNEIKYPNLEEAITNMTKQEKTLSTSDFQDYLDKFGKKNEDLSAYASEYGLRFNEFTNSWDIDNYDKYIQALRDDASTLEVLPNELEIAIDNAERQHKNKKLNDQISAFEDVIKNYASVTDDQLTALQLAVGNNWTQLSQYLTETGRGDYKLDVAALRNNLESLKLSEGISDAISGMFATIADDYMKDISTAVSLTTTGTTNQQDIQKFLNSYKELTGNITPANAFNYDSVLNAWTLDPAILTEYVEAQARELIRLGLLTTEELQSYIDTNVRQTLAKSIDIGSFLEDENKRATGKSYQALRKSLVNYFKSSDVLLEQLRDDYIESHIPKTAPQSVQGYIRSSIREYASAETIADYYISQIKQGGINAVQIMRAVAEAQGNELSASDIEAAYRVEVSEIENALDQLTYGLGSIVSGKAVKILQDAGYKLAYLDENNAVITGINDISAAYQAYYDALVESGEATLAAINEAKAKVLETKDNRGKEQSAIDALGDATGMTYTAFAEILSNAGIEMTDKLITQLEKDSVIKHVGGNKMSIIDFSKFASAMRWDFNSEEYISAFKSYNDSLIEMNHKAEKDIVKEITALKDAKPGEQLNVTQLWAALKTTANESILKNLRDQLNIYGASIKDGILTLSDSANLLEIARAIEQAAQDANLDLQDGLQEIADTIKEILQSYVEAIKKGIEGSLTNKESFELKSVAKQVGYNRDLRFVETAEGLKLAQESAIGLYQALKKVDALQASLVFDELNESLKDNNEYYESISSILQRIQEIEAKRGQGNTSKALEEELSLAKEILAVRSTTQDEGFNFMSGNIPGAQNNPLDYAKNWTSALQTIRDAFISGPKKKGQRGFIDYTDFYNIVTEMNRIAALGGPIKLGAQTLDGSMESAAKLIEQGAAALTAVDTGDVMVNLGAIGFNMAKGGADMYDGVTEGIQSLAKSQVSMLDAIIRVLELIVAMEALGDITGEDMNLDLGDVFSVSYDSQGNEVLGDFTTDFDNARKIIMEKATEGSELREALDHTKMSFNGAMRSMSDLLTMNASDLFPSSMSAEAQRAAKEAYAKMMNSFYQTAISGDYDLDNIADSVKKIMASSGLELQDFVFEYTDENKKVTRIVTFVGETIVDIDFTNDNIRKQVNDILGETYKDADEYREGVQTAIEQYKTGKNKDNEDLTLDEQFKLRTLIGISSEEITLSKDKNGNYVGTYGGQKFTGDKETILKNMADAAIWADEGFDWTIAVDKEGHQVGINASLKVGNTSVEVQRDGKKKKYIYKDSKGTTHTTDNQDSIMGIVARDGQVTDTGIYTFKDDKGKTQVTEVKQESKLKLTYTYYVDDDGTRHWLYNGQNFDSSNAMQSYMELKSQYDPSGNKEHINDKTKEAYIEVNEHATVRYTITASGVEPTYEIDGQPVGNKKAFDAYVTAMAQEGADITGTTSAWDGEVGANDRIISYSYNGGTMKVKVTLTDGGTQYHYEGGDGFIVDSDNEDVIKAAIAAHAELSDSEETKDSTTTITLKEGVTVNYTVTNGKVTFDDTGLSEEDKATAEALKAKMQAELDKNPQTLTNPVEASATSITITIAEGASVKLDGTVTVEDIEEASGKVKTLNVTAEKTVVGSSTENVDIPTLPDLTLDVNIDGAKSKIDEVVQYASEKKAFQKVEASGTNVGQLIAANVENAKSNKAFQKVEASGNNVPAVINYNVQYAAEHPAKQKVEKTEGEAEGNVGATGTIGLAEGNANARGTLMGELGPELVVSQGRYFVVGQNGPEMVNLADDAIVFNHLQTKSLLEKGTSSTRGRAITNEQKAVAYATGSRNGGPAMSSASAALSALKQLRAQWKALESMSAKDLAGKGGGGGGGGENNSSFIKELEKWYNWLQKIAQLEKEITHQETLRNKLQSDFNNASNGTAYYNSQKESLKILQSEVITQKALTESQQEYFNTRRQELNSSNNPFSSLYSFDSTGQLKYKEGKLEQLSYLTGTDTYGKPNMTAAEQYDYIINTLGISADYMKYDSSGKEIDTETEGWEVTAVQTFWDKIDADKEEMQNLHDSIEEHRDAMLKAATDQNEILKEMEDNQIAVEEKVYNAVVDMKQRTINELKDQKEAIKSSNERLLNGLSRQLERERSMYETEESEDELAKLQRQLRILQRSGGSVSEINSLQEEINDKSKDLYFNKQQEEIDKIQDASDAQIERLEQQISLQEETLEYQKKYGLLWDQVAEIMQSKDPQGIAAFITEHDSQYWGESPTKLFQDNRDILFTAEQFVAQREDTEGIYANTQTIADALAGQVNTQNDSIDHSSDETAGSWKKDDTGWWYRHDDGTWTSNDWEKINGDWYHFDSNGYMQTGWIQDGNTWYYLNPTEGSDQGKMQTGWINDGGTWYYTDENGAMQTGWQQVDSKWYYLNSSGAMQTGWFQDGETWYYLGSDGAMVTGEQEIDGKKYHFDDNGKWLGYSKGGIVDYTGLAMVHGTPDDPEAFLNAEDTENLAELVEALREHKREMGLSYDSMYDNDIVTNSLMSSVSGLLSHASTVVQGDQYNDSVIIEHAEVNMNLDRLNNRYDAQRAGDDIMQQMVNIARKTSANNRIWR